MLRFLIVVLGSLLLVSCAVDSGTAASSAQGTSTAVWQVSHREANGAVVSVWGAAPDDVWAAGGRQGQSLLLHRTSGQWLPVANPGKALLWSVYGMSSSDVYAVGEGGLVLHWNGTAWKSVASGTTRTLFGVWAAAPGDVWLVGGDPWGSPGDAVLLRGNSNGFQPVALPKDLAPAALYKAYGAPMGGVVAIGEGGAVLRFNGEWHRDDVPTDHRLVSLWGGGGSQLFAVGGEAKGILLHYDGAHWDQVQGVQTGLELFGVFKAPGQKLFAVGAGPRIVEFSAGGQPQEASVPEDLDPSTVLHSVWGDGQGQVFAVGGTLFGNPNKLTGAILQLGAGTP